MKKLYPILFVACFGCMKSQTKQVAYTITATSGANGTVTPAGVTSVPAGNDEYYYITPNTGYTIASLMVDNTPVAIANTYTFNTVASNHTISATFALAYTITATADSNGEVSPSGISTVVAGSSLTFTFIPNTDYHTDSLWIDGGFVKKFTVAGTQSYTMTNVTANHTLTVSFSNALTKSQLDSLNNLLLDSSNGAWHYIYVESKVDGGVFYWQDVFQAYPCIENHYLQFMPGNNYLWSINNSPCPFGWETADEIGTYTFIPPGQSMALTHNGITDTLVINLLTADSLVVTSREAYQTRTSIRYHCAHGKP